MAKGHKQTVTHAADAGTTAMQGQVYGAAQDAAKNYQTVGPNAGQTAAMNQFGATANLGMGGANALAGDPAAIQKLMNPYMNNVMDANQQQYQRNASMLGNTMNSDATTAGAFGGDRSAIASGAAQGNLGAAHMSDVAGLLRGGYQDAMGQASTLANLGMNATGNQFAGGGVMRDIAQQQANPGLMQQQILAAGMKGGNAGNTTDSTYSKTSAGQNILGAAATLGPMFAGMPPMPNLFGSSGGGNYGPAPTNADASLFGL